MCWPGSSPVCSRNRTFRPMPAATIRYAVWQHGAAADALQAHAGTGRWKIWSAIGNADRPKCPPARRVVKLHLFRQRHRNFPFVACGILLGKYTVQVSKITGLVLGFCVWFATNVGAITV
jgi:hypothetical protein